MKKEEHALLHTWGLFVIFFSKKICGQRFIEWFSSLMLFYGYKLENVFTSENCWFETMLIKYASVFSSPIA